MKWMIALVGILVLSNQSIAQDKKIDQLEILYDQAYFAKVLRKANKMLADPEFDYSGLPAYYKSLALFRLAGDARWFNRHKSSISEAIESYQNFSEHPSYKDYVNAHFYEISSLKSYLVKLEKSMNELGYDKEGRAIASFSFDYFKSIKSKPDKHENPTIVNNNQGGQSQRDLIAEYAKTLVGIKYVWAGSDESGFDCSGFTGYVLKRYGFAIARTASGQLEESKKVKLDNAFKGDLVFFGSGEKITHVGLVISSKGDDLSMVHASTSKGVIVTNIVSSTYWEPKLKAAGTYLD